MTTYRLDFVPSALKEWRKLDSRLQQQFRKKLQEIIVNPRIPSAQMRGETDVYRIKARSAGYRLIYEVEDRTITVFVLAVDRRERGDVFDIGIRRARERRLTDDD